MQDKSRSFRPRCVSARCGWCWSTEASTPRSGRRSRRSRRKIGCTAQTLLRTGCEQAERDQRPARPGTTDERERMKELERENRELRQANEILKQAQRVFRPGGARPPIEVMISFIDAHRDDARGRADLQGAADRPVDLSRARGPARRPGAAPRACQARRRARAARSKRVFDENFQVYGAARSGGSCTAKASTSLAARWSG